MAKRIVGVLRGWDEGLSLFAILGRMANYQHISHGFEPVFDEHSRILVLGSFPSVLSRENAFYYGNPQNRFWRVMAACLGEPVPQNEGGLSDNGRPLTLEESIAAKKQMLLEHGIALWDVIASCDIKGSSDASIKNVVPAQVERILEEAHIGAVICNGGTAGRLYKRYLQWQVGLAAHVLPSTSPANAAWQLERLTARWQEELLPLLEAAETGALGEVPSPSSVKRGFVTAKTQVAKRSSVNGADGGHASDPRDDTAANETGQQTNTSATTGKRHFMYVIECADGSLYTGYSPDVQARFATHQAGTGAKYTRGRGPLNLLAVAEFPTKHDAMSAEYRFKRLSRDRKDELLAKAAEPEADFARLLQEEFGL